MLFARYMGMILSAFVLLAVAGCSSELEPEFGWDAFTEEELALVENDQGCFTNQIVGSDAGFVPAGEVVEYDDKYIGQNEDGVCLTQVDLDEQAEIEAEEQAEEAAREAALAEHEAEIGRRTDTAIERHEANLPEYREELVRLTDSLDWDEVLSEAVTYYCLSDSTGAVRSALSEATREVYDSHWRADGTSIWPMSFNEAARRHGCRAPVSLEATLELIKDSSEVSTEPPKMEPEYYDPPPPVSEQENPNPG